jgi:hypothetical protein
MHGEEKKRVDREKKESHSMTMRTNRNETIPFSEASAADIFLPGPRFVRKPTIGAGLFISGRKHNGKS